MINIENLEHNTVRFESANAVSTVSQLIRNIEHFYDSALIMVNSDGNLHYFNSRASDLFELNSAFNAEHLNIRDLLNHLAKRGDFGPGDAESLAQLASSLLLPSGNSLEHFAQSYLTMPSGNVLRVLVCRNVDGSLTISARDVSDERRDENMLEMALDIGFAGYLIFDTVQISCRVESRYMANLLTYTEMQTLESTGLSSLLHSDDLARSQEMWDIVKTTREAERGTLRIVTQKEGVRWFRFVLMPESEAPQCTRIVAFFNDVTDTLRQQENLRQAKHLAEESLTSKETFLAHMSHEIRTPMNAVIGMTDALIHHHADESISPQLELIQKSALSILKMLDETLTHSRLDTDSFALDPAPASPAEVVRDVCALWEQQALKNNGVIRCTIKNDVPDIIVFDKYRYEQCVNNLLSNAVKFTHGGKIDVILTVVEKTAQAPYLVLAVRDTGIGMTHEQQSHIFEAYTQADKSISNRFGGTGLGMNITKQIVERMNGTISVRSEIGEGSMFAMSVPIVEETQDSTAVQATPTIELLPVIESSSDVEITLEQNAEVLLPQETATSTSLVEDMLIQAQPEATAYSALRILVVDDNPTNHLVIKSLLSSIVANISLANNGEEALDVLDSTPVDIVLMDIHMPIMDGIECTLAIRSSDKVWKDVIIIALTADPQYQQKKLCKNIGMDEALAKPVRLNDLLEAIDAVLPTFQGSDEGNTAASAQQIA